MNPVSAPIPEPLNPMAIDNGTVSIKAQADVVNDPLLNTMYRDDRAALNAMKTPSLLLVRSNPPSILVPVVVLEMGCLLSLPSIHHPNWQRL